LVQAGKAKNKGRKKERKGEGVWGAAVLRHHETGKKKRGTLYCAPRELRKTGRAKRYW